MLTFQGIKLMLVSRKMLGTDLYSCYNKLKCYIFLHCAHGVCHCVSCICEYIEESFLNDKKCYIYKVNPI